jgi:hypothetical protein
MKLFEISVDKPIVIDLVQDLLAKNKTVELDYQSKWARSVGPIYSVDWETFEQGGSEFSILYYDEGDNDKKTCLGLTGEATENLDLVQEAENTWLLHGRSRGHATP